MGGQRIPIQIESITGKDRHPARRYRLHQAVNQSLRQHLWSHPDGRNHQGRARPHLHCGHDFGFGIERHPDPDFLSFVAQSGTEFIQLHLQQTVPER
jgi:hypothetical protein